jgi:alkanesulfonate monooxygenase SsuD/methylene tetrahydromethanopterin reductase-like flavin-dependent oxidoreductase (luciferase family)
MTSLGIHLPTFDPLRVGGRLRVVESAQLAEQLGFDAVSVGDHLWCPAPVYDATISLAAAAAVTERVKLGFGVMLLGLRPPAWAAKQLVTLDALAPGRLVLGVGIAGEFPAEFEAAGVKLSQRGRRLDEILSVLPDLLEGRAVSHAGPALTLEAPALEPAITTLPPIYVGGRGEPALERAARFGDGWMPIWMSPERMHERGERLADLAEGYGRPAPKLALMLGVHVDEDEDRARARATEYIYGQYGMPFEKVERWTAFGSAERVAEYIESHRAVGVEHFTLMSLTDDPLTQIDRLAAVREIACAP